MSCVCQRRDAYENQYTAMQLDDKTGVRTSHLPTLMKKPNTEMYFLNTDAPSKIPHQNNLKKPSFVPCSLHLHTDKLQKVSAQTTFSSILLGCRAVELWSFIGFTKWLEEKSKYRLRSCFTRSGKEHHIKQKAKTKFNISAHSSI